MSRWIVLVCAMFAAFAFAAPAKGPRKMTSVPGQFVVELKRDRGEYSQVELEKRLGGKVLRTIRPNMVLVQREARDGSEKVARDLRTLEMVRLAEPNYIFRVFSSPNDVDYLKQWNMNNSGEIDSAGTRGLPGVDVGAERAWEVQSGSKDVIVAVVDTGIDYTHPELISNMWTNELEEKGQSGVDDDGNGFIDDIHGYNFVSNTGSPMDDHGHGTHCSGTIAANRDNSIGIAGLNRNVSVMAVKFLDGQGEGTLENAVRALDYTIKMKARILSNSWGGYGESEILKEAVGRTRDAGQVFVAAAGNDSGDNDSDKNTIPAAYDFDNIVSVAAIDNRGELASFSNYGASSVHVAAPGVNIYSTSMNGGYETMSGTSMAAPHVSGIAALLLAANPTLNDKGVKERIMKGARPLKGLSGKISGGGLSDAYYTLTGDQPPEDPNDPGAWAEKIEYRFSSDHPYLENANQTFKIQVSGAKKISVHFSKLETESGYDRVQFFNSKEESFGYLSGSKTDGGFGPIVDGDTVILTFTSDGSVNGYGFDIDSIAVVR